MAFIFQIKVIYLSNSASNLTTPSLTFGSSIAISTIDLVSTATKCIKYERNMNKLSTGF